MLREPPDAGVAELVDALDLGSSDLGRGGSTPFARTNFTPFASAHRRGSTGFF